MVNLRIPSLEYRLTAESASQWVIEYRKHEECGKVDMLLLFEGHVMRCLVLL